MQLERTRVDGHEYWVLRDDKGIAGMAESRDALLPAQRHPARSEKTAGSDPAVENSTSR